MLARPRLALATALLAVSVAACARRAQDAAPPDGGSAAAPASLHDFTVARIDGRPEALAAYRGKVALVVNVASECGFTPQYEGLERLHEELAPRGFAVLAFPSNDFGGQEPGEAAQIEAFARDRYHATFPLFAKVPVKGDDAAPLFRFLSDREGPPRWNFTKYLVGKDGSVRAKFASTTAPDDADLRKAIEAELARP